MSGNLAIQVEGLSKRYRIGLEEERHETLIGTLGAWVKSPLRRFRELKRLSSFEREEGDDIIWALRNVSFEVKPGEVVGIIGRNGAGKTTLLMILSQITEPTAGRAIMRGRVASLISVGTGFHGELSGRENIYLNGTILGMSKQEVDRKFDEIVDFSGVEKFIDTPVKRYSSGMRVRLGFAVAAHLEPDILIVDEVLAVGDLAFQKKCLGKMEAVAGEGRTVLFVSHNMQLIDMLCPRTILLNQGHIFADGRTQAVIEKYLEDLASIKVNEQTALHDTSQRRGSGKVRFTKVMYCDNKGQERFRFDYGETICFEFSYVVNEPVEGLLLRVAIGSSKSRETLAVVRKIVTTRRLMPGSENTIMLELPHFPFKPGIYPMRFEVRTPEENMESFEQRLSYDVLHDMTAPLVISADKEFSDRGLVEIDAVLRGTTTLTSSDAP